MILPATATVAAATRPGRRPNMAPTQTLRVDAYGLLPSLFIALMLVLAMLGVIAHAAVL
jgi:hypothetical protein